MEDPETPSASTAVADPAEPASSSAPTSEATVAAVADGSETLEGLKDELKEARKKLKETSDPKRVEYWQSKASKAENDIKTFKEHLESVPKRWRAYIEEAASRGMTAKQILEAMNTTAARTGEQTVVTKASRAESLELILTESDTNPKFASYLKEQLNAGNLVTNGNIEQHRSIFSRFGGEATETPATPAGSKPKPPHVAGGTGGPSGSKGPAWKPGAKGVDLIAQGLRGK